MLENKKHVEKLFKNSEKSRDKDGLLYIPGITGYLFSCIRNNVQR